MAREYRNFTREEKLRAVKMVLIDKKSQMEVERKILGKKNCTGTINRWIREYIQEGEDNCFKKKKGLKKVEITEENARYEILKKFNAFLEKEIRTNFNSSKNSKSNTHIMCEELEISRDAYYKWLKRKGNKNRYELNREIINTKVL